MNTIIKLDTRGRLVIPNEYREALDLRQGDNVLLSLDSKTNTITINPIYSDTKNLINIEITFGDKPGSLAKIATKLAELKVDLIMTESKSFERGEKARWNIIADISKTKISIQQIKKELNKNKFLDKMSIQKISRGRLHQ